MKGFNIEVSPRIKKWKRTRGRGSGSEISRTHGCIDSLRRNRQWKNPDLSFDPPLKPLFNLETCNWSLIGDGPLGKSSKPKRNGKTHSPAIKICPEKQPLAQVLRGRVRSCRLLIFPFQKSFAQIHCFYRTRKLVEMMWVSGIFENNLFSYPSRRNIFPLGIEFCPIFLHPVKGFCILKKKKIIIIVRTLEVVYNNG